MNYELMENNKVFLKGEIVSTPVFSHEVFGEGFYELNLSVKRLSDNFDIIPITVSERLLSINNFSVGSMVAIKGQFRSYNKMVDNKSKLLLTVFVRDLIDYDEGMNPNIIELSGFICKEPIYRTTPFKREICDMLLAVNRAYNKSDYLPCIAWGRNARFVKNIEVGQKVCLTGRIQSREYQKKLGDELTTKTAYEISISKIWVNSEDGVLKLNSENTLDKQLAQDGILVDKNSKIVPMGACSNLDGVTLDSKESC
ncbi:MAG: single-stranded DNA-binding protein [Clostridia bacterium]|nr:single-stranded DNA-binding protein [Clostridia bacterium]